MTGKTDEGDSVNEINSPLLKKNANTGVTCTKGPESRFKRMNHEWGDPFSIKWSQIVAVDNDDDF